MTRKPKAKIVRAAVSKTATAMAPPAPKKTTKFTPGKKHGPGRAKGQRNKTTLMLKEAILEAASLVGSDGRGKDGLVGYLGGLARTHKPVYARLLEKVLPMQIAVRETSNQRYTPDEAIERLKERGLPVPEWLMGLSSNAKAVIVAHALNDAREDGESDDLDNRCGMTSTVTTFEKDGLDDLDEEPGDADRPDRHRIEDDE